MYCIAICGDDYYETDSVVKARAWAKATVQETKDDAEIYRINPDGSMGDLYDWVDGPNHTYD